MTNEISVIPKTPSQVAKAIIYIVLTGASLLAAAQAAGGGALTLGALLGISIQVLALIPIYLFAGSMVKASIAFATAVLSTLLQVFVGGYHPLSFAEYVAVALAAFAAIGIAVVPNKAPDLIPVDPALGYPDPGH